MKNKEWEYDKSVPMKELVKDKEWQKVRKKLLGNWKKQPEWCVNQLENYLGNIKNTPFKKLRIVMNYLTGTAFRMGKISHPKITTLRKKISVEIKRRKIYKEKNS
ncbi:MAG: hypothetical protein ACOC3V_01675 [bacterium]